MFQLLLEKLSLVSVPLIGMIEEDGEQLINTKIFGKDFKGDVYGYKKIFFKKLRLKELKLLNIQEKVYKEKLIDRERKILLQEIENRLLKIEFLRYTYNIEANKIDSNIQIYYPYSIEVYNKAFFGVSKNDIGKKITLLPNKKFDNIYSKGDLLNLIKLAKKYCPYIEFKFGKYPNFTHREGVIRIPNQKKYNIQNIITLFFHEMTHFFRTLNGKRNLGFAFQFSGYSTLEEGIAIYNEYYYGNKICDYGKFIPYYNLCILALIGDKSESEKKDEIFEILSNKGFDKQKSVQYYNRFYKYCELGGKYIFLKDLIYNNGYKNVQKLIRKDCNNYKKIMSGDIGLKELEQGLIDYNNNYDCKKFFKIMVKAIKNL